MLSSRLKAFVIPTSQTIATTRREHVVPDQLDAEPGRRSRSRRGELGRELRERAQVADVVDQPGDEEERERRRGCRAAPRSPRPRRRRRPQPTPASRPARCPTPPKVGVGRVVPALVRRVGDEPLRRATGSGGAPRGRQTATGRAAIVTAALTTKGRGARLTVARHCLTANRCARCPTLARDERLRATCSATASCSGASSGAICGRSTRARCSGSRGRSRYPLALMLVYLVVFSVLWEATATDFDHYWLFLLCGLPPWAFFASSLQTSAPQPAREREPDPQGALPAAARPAVGGRDAGRRVCGDARDRARPLARFRAGRRAARPGWRSRSLRSSCSSSPASSLAVASANAVFRDVEYVVAALLPPWFFLTPILYQLEDLPGAEAHPWLVDLIHWGNPLTPAVESFRDAPLPRRGAARGRRSSTWSSRRSSRWSLGALVFRRSTTGSRSKPDHDRPSNSPSGPRRPAAPRARPGSRPGEQRRKQERPRRSGDCARRRVPRRRHRRLAGAPLAATSAGPDRRPALLVGVEQAARPVRRRARRRRRGARPQRLVARRPAPPGPRAPPPSPRSRAAVDDDGERRSAMRGAPPPRRRAVARRSPRTRSGAPRRGRTRSR